MDSIFLKGIELLTRIGVSDDERAKPQALFVDIELFHPAKDVAKSDDIAGGIDYQKVTHAVVAQGATERKTIERLAEDIAEIILKDFKPAGGVKVTVWKKPELPLESASVTIMRP